MTYRDSAYDLLASAFRPLSRSRYAYLSSIDRIVETRIPTGAQAFLDVGAGDGVRAWRIARSRRITRLVLAEPGEAMSAYCQRLSGAEVWRIRAEDLPEGTQKFDAVTCLWNVLGHVENHQKRLSALRKMRSLLSDRGQIFLDVNNRYNARSYGWVNTLGRILYDRIRPSETNGDVSYTWRVGDQHIPSNGHVFTPREMDNLVAGAGLRANARYVIDYETGRRYRSVFRGQLFYVLSKR